MRCLYPWDAPIIPRARMIRDARTIPSAIPVMAIQKQSDNCGFKNPGKIQYQRLSVGLNLLSPTKSINVDMNLHGNPGFMTTSFVMRMNTIASPNILSIIPPNGPRINFLDSRLAGHDHPNNRIDAFSENTYEMQIHDCWRVNRIFVFPQIP